MKVGDAVRIRHLCFGIGCLNNLPGKLSLDDGENIEVEISVGQDAVLILKTKKSLAEGLIFSG